MAKSAANIRPFGIRDEIGYAFGDLGCNLSFQLISTYMYLFYTQCIGVSAEHWAWIIIVSKIWDAVNDVLIGRLVDSRRIGTKNKFIPWILVGGVGLVVLTVMVFTPIQGLPQTAKIIWCLASYCLWSVAYTLVNVPYGSLHSVLTENPKQRTALSTFRSIGAGVGVVFTMLLPHMVYDAENQLSANRMFLVSIVFSVAALGFFFALSRMVTERVTREETHEKVNYISTVKSFFTNRAMVGITVATVAIVIFYNSSMSVNNLVFQFYFNDAKKSSLAMIASYVPLVAMMPFASMIVSKIGKKKFICISGLVSAAAGALMLFLPITPDKKGMVLYVGGLMLVNIGCCVFQIIVWAIVADCIEKSYREKGVREEGSLYAIYSFFRKLAQGVGSALVALSLGTVGYVENAAVQTAEASAGIKNLYIIFLIVGLAVMTLSMQFIYNIGFKEEQAFGEASEQKVG